MDWAKRRADARDAYRASLAAGRPLSGAELGRRFGSSPRWGRERVTEVQTAIHSDTTATPPERDAKPQSQHPKTTSRATAASPPADRRGGTGRAQAATPAAGNTTRRPASPARVRPVDTPTVTPAVRRITTLAVLAVAAVAAVASYDHQRVLAELAGEGWRAWMLPISVDGLVVAASMSMLVQRRAGLPAGALTWLALIAGIGASLAANVAAATPTPVGRLVAAWPPLAFAVAFELAVRVRAHNHNHNHDDRRQRR
ncbi:MAG: DUF2637 domain-containing protein [Acidimicrobiales bacterium]